mgnify:CR=1 FL=1
MPFQPGNTEGAKSRKAKPYADALRIAIMEASEDKTKLRAIAEKHVALAIAGDMQAIKEIADRLDGKVPQAIAGIDEDEQLTPLVPIINLTVGPKPNPASKAGSGVPDEGH